MKKFNVTVNGKSYVVEVEEVGGGSAPVAPRAAAPVAAPVAPAPVVPTPAPVAAPVAAPVGGGTIVAPMSGTVSKHVKKVGDSVKHGDVIVILEAMKMENDITAPCDGTVKEIRVSEGTPVQPGEVIAVVG